MASVWYWISNLYPLFFYKKNLQSLFKKSKRYLTLQWEYIAPSILFPLILSLKERKKVDKNLWSPIRTDTFFLWLTLFVRYGFNIYQRMKWRKRPSEKLKTAKNTGHTPLYCNCIFTFVIEDLDFAEKKGVLLQQNVRVCYCVGLSQNH